MNDYVGTVTAADILGVSPDAVRKLYGRGTLAGVWCDGRLLYRRSAVVALANDPGYRVRSRSAKAARAS